MGIKIDENSKVSFSVKLLIGIIIGLFSIATIGYFDVIKKQNEQKEYFEERLEEERRQFREIIRDEFSYIRKDNSAIREDITTIRENIARILARSNTNVSSTSRRNEQPPENF